MDKEVELIRRETLRLCWSMRGGVSYEAAMNMSANERKILADITKENMDTTKKSGLPYF